MAPPTPTIVTAFLSVRPLEPVLELASPEAAQYFQSKVRQGRILEEQNPCWVFLPMPEGLLRVRTARDGDVAFDFDGSGRAKAFNEAIKGLGRIFANSADKPTRERTVYVGTRIG